MRRLPRIHRDTVIFGGLLGGLLVGICEGVQAALRADIGVARLPASALLGGAAGVLVGFVVGVVVVLVIHLSRWGRRRYYTRTTDAVAFIVVGLGTAFATGATLRATDGLPKRFAAAWVVALVAAVAGTVGALIGPALARALAPMVLSVRQNEQTVVRKMPTAPPTVTPAGLFVFAPLAGIALTSLVFLVAWKTRASPIPWVQAVRLAWCSLVVAMMPFAISYLSERGARIPLLAAAGGTLVLIGLPVGLFVWKQWTVHMRFLPWRDVRIVVLVMAAGIAISMIWQASRSGKRPPPVLRGWRRWRRRLAFAFLLLSSPTAAAGAGMWLAARSEQVRKATSSKAGLVGPLLALVRPAFDDDGDGYARILGGGDCNDSDATVNPAARDWPDDLIDQDCDGQDISLDVLASPPLPSVPDVVPRDLNILLVVISSLRADHLGCYGYERKTSPEIDRLAADGVLFENAWAHSPSSRLAMPSIITGRWPSAIDWSCSPTAPGLARSQRTIGEVLRARGYLTAAFHPHDDFKRLQARGFERGIQFYDDRRAALHRPSDATETMTGSSAREVADDVLDFLKMYAGKEEWKFFVTAHFVDPDPAHEKHFAAPDFGSEPEDLYDSEIAFTDRHVGRIIAGLKARGLYDKTAIVVTADHGEGFDEHAGVRVPAGAHLYAAQTKIPFIVRVPGIRPRRVKVPVGNMDVAPSLLSLARGEAVGSFLGRSVLDLMTGAEGAGRASAHVFQEATYTDEGILRGRTLEGILRGRTLERHAVATATHHLIWQRAPENTFSCYDVAADPAERFDLWATRAGEEVCTALSLELRRRVQLLQFAEPPPEFVIERAAAERAADLPARTPQFLHRARFGAAIDFVGHDVAPAQVDQKEVRLSRCDKLTVTTHFEVSKHLAGWELFLQLDGPPRLPSRVDQQGPILTFPGERWFSGQKIRDRFTIAAHAHQPPGVYTLYLGFGRPAPASNVRLPIIPKEEQDGQNRLRLLSFTVD